MNIDKTNNRKVGRHIYVVVNILIVTWAVLVIMSASSILIVKETLEPLSLRQEGGRLVDQFLMLGCWVLIVIDILALLVLTNRNLKENKHSFVSFLNTLILLVIPVALLVFVKKEMIYSIIVGWGMISAFYLVTTPNKKSTS